MIKKEKIEQEIEKTLDQFERADKLPPNPYFYTRIQARLNENHGRTTVISTLLKPALLAALLIINLSTAIWYLNPTSETGRSDTHQELIELLANDFNQDYNKTDLLNFE